MRRKSIPNRPKNPAWRCQKRGSVQKTNPIGPSCGPRQTHVSDDRTQSNPKRTRFAADHAAVGCPFRSRLGLASSPLSFCHSEFEVDAEAVSEAVHVVEEGDHLGGVVDGPVVEAHSTQRIDVSLCHFVRGTSELDSVVTQSTVDFGELGFGVIGLDLLDPLCVFDLDTEVITMGFRSVDAAVSLGDDDSQHLALGTCQG